MLLLNSSHPQRDGLWLRLQHWLLRNRRTTTTFQEFRFYQNHLIQTGSLILDEVHQSLTWWIEKGWVHYRTPPAHHHTECQALGAYRAAVHPFREQLLGFEHLRQCNKVVWPALIRLTDPLPVSLADTLQTWLAGTQAYVQACRDYLKFGSVADANRARTASFGWKELTRQFKELIEDQLVQQKLKSAQAHQILGALQQMEPCLHDLWLLCEATWTQQDTVAIK